MLKGVSQSAEDTIQCLQLYTVIPALYIAPDKALPRLYDGAVYVVLRIFGDTRSHRKPGGKPP